MQNTLELPFLPIPTLDLCRLSFNSLPIPKLDQYRLDSVHPLYLDIVDRLRFYTVTNPKISPEDQYKLDSVQKLSLTGLDQALLNGIDSVLTYFEPLVASMAQTKATQERATLNHDDLKQHARMTIVRCFNSMDRVHMIRSFEAVVKSSVYRNILTQVGKEFCKSRGRFLIEEFTEVIDTASTKKTITANYAETAYDEYNSKMTQDSTLQTILNDIYRVVPPKYHEVLNAVLNCDTPREKFKVPTYKKIGEFLNLKWQQVIGIVDSIKFSLMPFKGEFFGGVC